MTTSLYIHIPFCRQKCLYCDFYSIPYDQGRAVSYMNSVISQIEKIDTSFSTIYIGGGTPSILDIELLSGLLDALKKYLKDNTEFTIEVNPESVTREKLKLFLDKGINRISIGAQSFNDNKLKLLGRLHNAIEAEKAIDSARKTGFKNISIDMIFGVTSETMKAWQKDLKKATRFDIKHISCYCLSYEKGTPFFKIKHMALDERILTDMYQYAMRYLPQETFQHYEVSNFSKPGFECAHNLNYWDNNFYIGLGPSSVSYIDYVRSKNIPEVSEYINRHNRGLDLRVSMEKLSPVEQAKETASLKIRTQSGIDFDWFKNKTGFDFKEIEKDALSDLLENDLIECDNKGVHLTEKGFLFSDTVSSALL